MPTINDVIQEVIYEVMNQPMEAPSWAGQSTYYIDYLWTLFSEEEKRKEAPNNFNILFDKAARNLKLKVETAINRDAEFMALSEDLKVVRAKEIADAIIRDEGLKIHQALMAEINAPIKIVPPKSRKQSRPLNNFPPPALPQDPLRRKSKESWRVETIPEETKGYVFTTNKPEQLLQEFDRLAKRSKKKFDKELIEGPPPKIILTFPDEKTMHAFIAQQERKGNLIRKQHNVQKLEP